MLIKPAPQTYLNSRGEQVIVVGFSGSRIGMSPLQIDILRKSLEGKTGEFHHGDCIGADAEAHDLLRQAFPDKWRIIIHPPVKNQYRAFKLGDEVRPAKDYIGRNHDIVDSCNVFLAAPKDTNQIGGTWNTIDYFRRVVEHEYENVSKGKFFPRVGEIILPNGNIGHIMAKKKGILDAK